MPQFAQQSKFSCALQKIRAQDLVSLETFESGITKKIIKTSAVGPLISCR